MPVPQLCHKPVQRQSGRLSGSGGRVLPWARSTDVVKRPEDDRLGGVHRCDGRPALNHKPTPYETCAIMTGHLPRSLTTPHRDHERCIPHELALGIF